MPENNVIDPDAYIAAKTGGMTPDAYIAAKTAPTPYTKTQSFARGALEGASLGTAPTIVGGLQAFKQSFTHPEEPLSNLGPSFSQYKNEQYAKNAAARQQNPMSYLGGEAAGGTALALVPGLGELSIPKVATMSAIQGYNANPESSLGGLKPAWENARNALEGGAVGATVGKGFDVAGDIAGALNPQSLENYANRRALSVVGANKPAQAALSPAEQQMIGKSLRDQGIAKFGASLDDVLSTSTAAKESSGAAIGKGISTVDDLISKVKAKIDDGAFDQPQIQAQFLNDAKLPFSATPLSHDEMKMLIDKYYGFGMHNIADRIDSELIAPNLGNPLLKNEVKKLEGIRDDFNVAGAKSTAFGHQMKGQQGRQTNFNSDTVPQEFKQDLYGLVKDELNNSVDRTPVLNTLAGDISPADARRALEKYNAAKANYRAANFGQEAAEKGISGQNANRTLGLYDVMAGVGAAASGHSGAAIPVAVGSKMLKKYGAGAQMKGAELLGQGLGALPEAVQKVSPWTAAALQKGGAQVGASNVIDEINPFTAGHRAGPVSPLRPPGMADGGVVEPNLSSAGAAGFKKAFKTPPPKPTATPVPDDSDNMLTSIYKYAKSKIKPNSEAQAEPGYAHGAIVPGEPKVDGDNTKNDTVHLQAMVSPEEAVIVIPRSVMHDLSKLKEFVKNLKDKDVHHGR